MPNDYGPNRSAPYNQEAEEAALGCVLIDPESYALLKRLGLKAEHFHLHKNRWIWDACVANAEAGMALDLVTVTDALEEHNQLAEAGGVAYLTQLINAVPTSLHAESYAKIIIREAQRRGMIEEATNLAKLAYAEDIEPERAIALHRHQMDRLVSPSIKRGKFMYEAVPAHFDELRRIANDPDEQAVITTTFPDWDELTGGGLFKGDFDLLAGKPGAGKSALMLQIAKTNAAKVDSAGRPHKPLHVGYWCLEMPMGDLLNRQFSARTQIETLKFRRARFSEDDWARLIEVHDELADYQMYLDCTPGLTVDSFEGAVAWLMDEWGLDLAVVDYLQLMQGERRTENRVQEMSSISRGLRQVSLKHHIALLAGSQFSRKADMRGKDDQRPQLGDLKESGSLEQDSTGVAMLHPEKGYRTGTVILGKLRNGAVGEFDYVFEKQFATFKPATSYTVDLRNL